jgi:arylsulfatase A-like enzyme
MSGRPPDILVIVLDAVRSPGTLPQPEATTALPFLQKFGASSVVFPRAVATAPWTLPSVGSIMTGLYPWYHGASALGSPSLSPSIPTIAGLLREQGYATMLLSANGIVGPRTNLSSGFEFAHWADWWEQYIRIPRQHPRALLQSGSSIDRVRIPAFKDAREGLLKKGMRFGFRHPALLERASRIAQRVTNSAYPYGLSICPWIEPTLSTFLNATRQTTPTFSFLHLNDAHEPYYSDTNHGSTPFWGRTQSCRQDYMRAIEGTWSASPLELATIHDLYLNALRALDLRVKGIIDHFLEVRGEENSMVVVTADHGQALGEGGSLFHMVSAEESVLRVPLVVRFPHSDLTGVARGWASLVDIFPTLLNTIGKVSVPDLDGRVLSLLLDADREDPVYSLGDGVPWRHLEGIVMSPQGSNGNGKLDRTWIASYEGAGKTVFDLQHNKFDYSLVDPPLSTPGTLAQVDQGPSPAVQSRVHQLSTIILNQVSTQGASSVFRRLASWGYGL